MNINLNLVGGGPAIGGAFALPLAGEPVWAAATAAPAPPSAPASPALKPETTPPTGIVFAQILGLASDNTAPAGAPATGHGDSLATTGDAPRQHDDKPTDGYDDQPDAQQAAPQAGTALPAMAMPLQLLLMPQFVPAPHAGDAPTGLAKTNATGTATGNVSGTGTVAAAVGTPATGANQTDRPAQNKVITLPSMLATTPFNRRPAPGTDAAAADESSGLPQAGSAVVPTTTPTSVLASAPMAGATRSTPPQTLTLAGSGPAWQQPLKDALGDQLQLQLGRNSDHAVIRLDPPDLGRIDISVKQGNGTLQVSLSASNGDVLRQLHAIGDSLRQDLAQRSSGDVAVQITASAASPGSRGAPAQGYADGDGRQRQPQHQREHADTPGRALDESADDTAPAAARFALYRQQ